MIDYIYDIDIHTALVAVVILSFFSTILFLVQLLMNRHSEMLIKKFEFEKIRELKRIMQSELSTDSKNEDVSKDFPDKTKDDDLNHSEEEHQKDSFRKIEGKNKERLMKLFSEMSCNPHIDEQENLGFAYQGENFLVMFNGPFIRIWDLSWYSIKPTDDKYPLIKDAVNYANFSFGPSIVMHSPDEDGNVMFSSRVDIPIVNLANDLKGYVEAVLDSFFALKQSLSREVNRLKTEPQDRTLHDNPIGFDTASLSDPHSPQAN